MPHVFQPSRPGKKTAATNHVATHMAQKAVTFLGQAPHSCSGVTIFLGHLLEFDGREWFGVIVHLLRLAGVPGTAAGLVFRLRLHTPGAVEDGNLGSCSACAGRAKMDRLFGHS